jgi:hypothetical protein
LHGIYLTYNVFSFYAIWFIFPPYCFQREACLTALEDNRSGSVVSTYARMHVFYAIPCITIIDTIILTNYIYI